MNLYIIENVFWDYTPGMVCIVAKDLDQCRDLYKETFVANSAIKEYDEAIRNNHYKVLKVVDETPRIVSYVYGGGGA